MHLFNKSSVLFFHPFIGKLIRPAIHTPFDKEILPALINIPLFLPLPDFPKIRLYFLPDQPFFPANLANTSTITIWE
jgi:hypothetical protein